MPACRDSSPCFCQTQLVQQPEAQRGAETGLTLSSVIHKEVGVRPQLEVEEQEIPCVGGVEMHVARVGLGSEASSSRFCMIFLETERVLKTLSKRIYFWNKQIVEVD